MKVEWRLFAGLGLLLAPFTILYWVTSDEAGGTALLVVIVVMFLFVAGYFLAQARVVGPRPEDRPEASPEEAEEEKVVLHPSIWPLLTGAAALFLAYGLVFTVFVAVPGAVLLALSVMGWGSERHPT